MVSIGKHISAVTWQSAAFALWESFTAIAVSAGLITLFREKYNRQSPLIIAMSKSAFAVYVFHLPVIIAITLLAVSLALPPVIKFIVMTAVCVPVCFAAAHLIFTRIPL
jgi:glucan biosynthesis protein C